MNHLSTDVLIIGSGGAGLRAAIEAQRLGVKVILVSKSKIGLASCTASSMGVFRISQEEKDIEKHFQETLEAGRALNNPNLVKILVTEAWSAIKGLEKFGIKLLVEKDKASVIANTSPAGTTLSKALSNYVLSLGINVLEKTIAFNVIVEGNRCLGALVFKKDTGEIIEISAKATVLATGGYAGLYIRNDNPQRITGDGIALAFKAGAELQDLEFVQFQPMFIDAGVPRMSILDWLIETTKNLVPGGPLINRKKERFLSKYGLLEQKILRDNLIVAIEREVFDEKNDFVIFDLTSLSSNKIKKAFKLVYQKRLIRPFKQIFSTKKLHIASFAHYTMGGVRINEKCETKVKGLYAVGEITSGIHGANRLGGNALTEIIVFGKIAGQQAAKYAKHVKLIQISQKHVKENKKALQEFCKKTKPKKIKPLLVKNDIRSIVSRFCGPIRSRKRLRFALEGLQQIEEKISFIFTDNPKQLEEAVEAKFMLLLAKLVLNSALARRESRGAHFRLDFPQSDDKRWLKNIIMVREGKLAKITSKKERLQRI